MTLVAQGVSVGASERRRLAAEARQIGFDICRFTRASLPLETGARLELAIGEDHHATMAWLADTAARRKSPEKMWDQARSAILFGMNYGPRCDPLAVLEKKERGAISIYARNRDYHELIKGRLKQLAGGLASRTGAQAKVFVDTAPLMEKPLAERAGLGWQGKHTNLVSRDFGSWLFLGAILTDAAIEPDAPEADHCGNCRACLDICPTKAFPAPYRLDARRCISYLTIEHHGPIPREFRAARGNRIFGCDDCLAVSPWNKSARAASEAKLAPRPELDAPMLAELAALDDAAFRKLFAGSPVKRIGRNRFIRNVLIAIGNSGLPELAASARPHLSDPDPAVRGAAVWALSILLPAGEFVALRPAGERDETVLNEWRLGKAAA